MLVGLPLRVEKQPNGEWSAIDDNYDLGAPMGWGDTREAAIDDLVDQIYGGDMHPENIALVRKAHGL